MVRLEREGFLRGEGKIVGVIASDFRILELRLIDLEGDVAVAGGGYMGNEEVEAGLGGKGKGEGSTCETCSERMLSVDLGGIVVGGNGKFDKLRFNIGLDNVVIGIELFDGWELSAGNDGEGGMVRDCAGRCV